MSNTIIEKAGTADHPITVERASGRVVLSVGNRILAETTDALILREAKYPPTYYFPKSAVPNDFLNPATKVTHCPYKGDAMHWKAQLADGRDIDPIAWSYEAPIGGMTSIAGYLGFYVNAFDGEFSPAAQ